MSTPYHVLRLEHPQTEHGPFWHNDSEHFRILPYAMPASKITMDIKEEHLDSWSKDYVCGCEYISQLYIWFDGVVDQLLEAGYKVYLYTLPKEKILFTDSGEQVAFRKADVIETVVLYEG